MAYELAKAYVQIVPTTKGFGNQLDSELGKETKTASKKYGASAGSSFKSGFGSALKGLAGLTGAAIGAGASLVAVATSAADNLDKVQKGAQKLGLSYEAYQKLSYAADRSGTSIDKFSKGIKNITNIMTGMVEEDSKAAEAFDSLGVATKNALGEMRGSDEVMMDAILALADMEDVTQRNAIANQIFGSSYQDLQPLLNNGSEGIKELMQNAEDLGLVMSNEAVDGGAKFKDQLDDVKASLGAVVTNIGADLMPVVSELLQWVTAHMPEIKQTVSTVFDYVSKFFEDVKPLMTAVKDLVVDVVWPAIKAIIDSGVLQLFLDAAKTGIEYISSALQTLGGVVKLFQGDWDGGWETIKNNFGPVVNHLLTTFNPLYSLLETIRKLIEWIEGKNIDEIAGKYAPEDNHRFGLEAPLMATGGTISSSGLAIVGEAGAELINMPKGATVTPLNDNNNAFSGMNKRLDQLIALMASSGSGDTVIPVYIGNQQIDEIIVGANSRITTRSGGFA